MSERFQGVLGRRGVIVAFAVVVSLPLAIGAYGASGHFNGKKASAVKAANSDDNQTRGAEATDTTARFHGDGTTSCDLPGGAQALSGNWTHGDYVSAWAKWAAAQKKAGLSTESNGKTANTAAQSDCGKPTSSLESHGQSAETHGAGESGEGVGAEKSAEAHTHRDAHKP